MEVATTERHWNDTSVPERPELEVLLFDIGSFQSLKFYDLAFMKLQKFDKIFFSLLKSKGWYHDDALWQVTCSMIIFNMQVNVSI